MRWTEVPAAAWRTPQELVEEGFRPRHGRPAPGHGGAATRRRQAANTTAGRPTPPTDILAQPDMAELIQAALALGWTLWR